jgi:uncharacterized repeat protein (TIGR03806 family)
MDKGLVFAFALSLGGASCSSAATPGAEPNGPLDAGATDTALDAATEAQTEVGSDGCQDAERWAGRCATLADYGLFMGTGATQEPRAGVFPYEVLAPLFADEAGKHRFIALPTDGPRVRYADPDPWDLAVGSIVVKTFFYPRDARDPTLGERLVETRLLIRGPSEIVPITYVWNAAQTEAVREVSGAGVQVEWIDETGAPRTTSYRVPTTNDCRRCHGQKDVHLLGVRTRQLDRASTAFAGENQIDALAARGLFESPPPPGPREHMVDPRDDTQPIDVRARSYLDANCGHCHNANAAAEWSGLEIDWGTHPDGVLGVCKTASSAGDTGGRRFDIVPGKPDQSVMIYRMQLTNSPYRMPESSQTPDAVGIRVVGDWIAALAPSDCVAGP